MAGPWEAESCADETHASLPHPKKVLCVCRALLSMLFKLRLAIICDHDCFGGTATHPRRMESSEICEKKGSLLSCNDGKQGYLLCFRSSLHWLISLKEH
jgi:hypothetical protein